MKLELSVCQVKVMKVECPNCGRICLYCGKPLSGDRRRTMHQECRLSWHWNGQMSQADREAYDRVAKDDEED